MRVVIYISPGCKHTSKAMEDALCTGKSGMMSFEPLQGRLPKSGGRLTCVLLAASSEGSSCENF